MIETKADVIIIGGGIIGISLALEMDRRGASVHVLERGEPGREASHAAAGMLAASDPETPPMLKVLGGASAKMYPEWVARIELESGEKADLRLEGCIYLSRRRRTDLGEERTTEWLKTNEPNISGAQHIYWTNEGSVDPRALMKTLLAAAKKNGITISHDHPVGEVLSSVAGVTGVRVGNKKLSADVVVNCAGAWSAEIAGVNVPTLPVKGQMLAVVDPRGKGRVVTHVLRGDDIYMVPRSDGRILIGATLEDAGFDKTVNPETVLRMRDQAAQLVPQIREMRIHESWAGLRPGTPDKLPVLGQTAIKNYFVATGHYRNGILLAPITAKLMAQVIEGARPDIDLQSLALNRFTTAEYQERH